MFIYFFKILFLLFSIFVLIKTIFYGIYEINTEQNKIGGISVICFCVVVLIFSNVVIFFK